MTPRRRAGQPLEELRYALAEADAEQSVNHQLGFAGSFWQITRALINVDSDAVVDRRADVGQLSRLPAR